VGKLANLRKAIAGAAAILVLAAVLVVAAHFRHRGAPAGTTATSRPGVEVQEPVISHAEKGKLAWQLQLRQVQVATGGRTVTALGVREGLIYNAAGKPVVRVTAERVAGDTATRDFVVNGNVNVVGSDGTVFTTDQVKWAQQAQRIECPGVVVMRDRRATVSTTGLSYYVNESRVVAPNLIKMVNGANNLVGHNLRYDTKTAAFEMENVQGVLNPSEVRQQLKETRR
jgi:hypothetical protein